MMAIYSCCLLGLAQRDALVGTCLPKRFSKSGHNLSGGSLPNIKGNGCWLMSECKHDRRMNVMETLIQWSYVIDVGACACVPPTRVLQSLVYRLFNLLSAQCWDNDDIKRS